MGLLVYGFIGLWVYRFIGLWVYRFMGLLVYKFMGLRLLRFTDHPFHGLPPLSVRNLKVDNPVMQFQAPRGIRVNLRPLRLFF